MRILHVVPTYLPARRYGGPIESVHGLARSLVLRGHTVDVITTNVDGPVISAAPLGTRVDLDGVGVYYYGSPFPRLYWSPSMGRALKERVADYDIVHGHSIFLWPTAAASHAAARAGVPSVISPRGMLVNSLIVRKSSLVKRAWLRLVERRNFGRSSAIHFTSRGEWDEAAQTGMPLPSPFIVPNGIEIPPQQNLERMPATVLYLGRVNWKKGIDLLIEAVSRLPQARLIIAGNDEEALARTLPASSQVSFTGHVTGKEKDRLLRQATILVLPSHNENFGNVVLEAMAVGTPVIVTPGVGLAADVAESEAGLVTSNDPDLLAAAIDQLLQDRQLRDRMGENGRVLAMKRFSWSRIAAQMEEEYCSIRSRR